MAGNSSTARRSLRFVAKDLLYGLCWIGARASVKGIRVGLLYHSVGGDDPSSVSTADFSRQMAYLRRHFRIVCLRDFRATIEASESSAAIACVTFDDGLLDNFERALPILQERGIPVSVFIPTGSIGEARS